MAFQVSGKTAIVTGAGSGINFSFAELLLSRNCNVVIADLTLRPEAKALIAKFSTGQPRAVFQETDVTVWAQLDRMFERATEEFGGADVVCPGAGVYEPVSMHLSSSCIHSNIQPLDPYHALILFTPYPTPQPSHLTSITALVQLLARPGPISLNRCCQHKPLRTTRYQPNPSNPHHPNRPISLLRARCPRLHRPHLQYRRRNSVFPNSDLRC